MIKLSVIIPVYNSAEKLIATLNSLRKLCNQQVEILVIDGASTDNTLQVCRQYSRYITYFVSEKDNGIYDAMNKGIQRAHGKYLYFIGAGDEFLLCHSEVLRYLEGNEDFIYGNCFFKIKKIIHNGKYTQWKIANNNICHQAIFYNKKIFKKFGLYNTKYRYFADWWMNIQCFADKNISKKYIDVVVANYEEGGFSHNAKETTFFKERDCYIYANYDKYVAFLVFVRRKLAMFYRIVKNLV